MTYPVVLDGAQFAALVVGGGSVAARKTRSLLDGGVTVTVVAPEVCPELANLAAKARLNLVRRVYEPSDLDAMNLVVAATSDSAINKAVARDAMARRVLVNVVDDPDAGNFVSPSVHRSGELTIAVSSGRTPAAASAIRAELARRFDGRYDAAIRSLRALREKLLGAGRRDEWKRASRELIGDDFCDDVEKGRVEPRVTSWR